MNPETERIKKERDEARAERRRMAKELVEELNDPSVPEEEKKEIQDFVNEHLNVVEQQSMCSAGSNGLVCFEGPNGKEWITHAEAEKRKKAAASQ